MFLSIGEILVGSASTISTSTMGIFNPFVGIRISSSTALLTSNAILVTKENISKLKVRYNKLSEYINVITLLYARNSKQSFVDKEIGEKENAEVKRFIFIP